MEPAAPPRANDAQGADDGGFWLDGEYDVCETDCFGAWGDDCEYHHFADPMHQPENWLKLRLIINSRQESAHVVAVWGVPAVSIVIPLCTIQPVSGRRQTHILE
ncbi:hypothetical protein FALBO_11208 [Fusarium albosuccineum]|uniref:Uncharacterized protein n=1 Tax=Fusarium albosuccineum TaxID=1237068 RepID=A0A8H4PAA1_9HYPO|nr:hypothetical protein FALBO_11208 [Fusarium albosuccineum]